MDSIYDYGERTCLECGKKYQATYAQQLTCSEACKKARMRRVTRARGRAYHQRRKDMLETLRNNLAAITQERDELLVEVKRLHEELATKVPVKKPSKQWCERLKLKADELPCGERPECFANPTCDKAK